MMELKLELDLDDLGTGDHWGTTVDDIIRDELKACIRTEIKKGIRDNAKLKRLVKDYQDIAIQEAYKAMGGK